MKKRAEAPMPIHFEVETRERILFCLKTGGHWCTAAAFAGLSPSTLREWRKWAKQWPMSDVGKFIAECRKAMASAETTASSTAFTGAVAAAKRGNVKPLEDFLVMRWPERWGRKRVELTGRNGGPIEHRPLAKLDDAKLEQLDKWLNPEGEPNGD